MLRYPSTPLNKNARQVVARLQAAGFTALWAGGCVRDLIMGRAPQDYDIATNATPAQVLKIFPRALAVGKAFGVVRVALAKHEFEVATFRKDHAYQDGRHPQRVSFTNARLDALRRDFTINALFFDPLSKKIHDYVNGRADIAAGIIRSVGRPAERFAEDYLRMLRAIRFATTLDFQLESQTLAAIHRQAAQIINISAERIQQELTRILLEAKQAGDALILLLWSGLLQAILPEVVAMRGQAQPPQFHPEGDVFLHTVLMLNAMPQRSLRLAYAILLHDIGKPPTAQPGPDNRIRFYGHAEEGARIATEILTRLRLPGDDIKAITFAIGNHMRFMDVRKMRRATLRRLVGAATFPLELELHRLDCLTSHGDLCNFEFLKQFQEACRAEPILPPPWISGSDLLALGVPQGPRIGYWKQLAYDAQLEKTFNSRPAGLAWLKKQMRAQQKENS